MMNNIRKIQNKVTQKEAIQFTESNIDEVLFFCKDIEPVVNTRSIDDKPFEIIIPTLEGNMKAHLNDWIIKGLNGEFYPCKPDIFEKSYEFVDVDEDSAMRWWNNISDEERKEHIKEMYDDERENDDDYDDNFDYFEGEQIAREED